MMYKGEMWAAIRSSGIAGIGVSMAAVGEQIQRYEPGWEPATWQDGYRLAYEAALSEFLLVMGCLALVLLAPRVTGRHTVEWRAD